MNDEDHIWINLATILSAMPVDSLSLLACDFEIYQEDDEKDIIIPYELAN